MGKFNSKGLLAVTGALAGLGAGLGNAAQQYAGMVRERELARTSAEFDLEKVKLADQLAGQRLEQKNKFDIAAADVAHQRSLETEGVKQQGRLQELNTQVGGNIAVAGMNIAGSKDETGARIAAEKELTGAKIGSAERMSEADRAAKQQSDQAALAFSYKKLAQDGDIEQQRLGASLVQQMMAEHGLNDRAAQNRAHEQVQLTEKGKQAIEQIQEQYAQAKENMQAEYGFKETMSQAEFGRTVQLVDKKIQADKDLNEAAIKAAKVLADQSHGEAFMSKTDKNGDLVIYDKTGKVLSRTKGFGGEDGATKGDAVMVSALLKASNDIRTKINSDSFEDKGPLYENLRFYENWMHRLTGVNLASTETFDYGPYSEAPRPAQPVEQALQEKARDAQESETSWYDYFVNIPKVIQGAIADKTKAAEAKKGMIDAPLDTSVDRGGAMRSIQGDLLKNQQIRIPDIR